VASGGLVDLGTYSDGGGSSIHATSAYKYVSVRNRVAGLGDVKALGNWWGDASPPSTKFSANVDYSSPLATAPTLSYGLETEALPSVPTLAFRPNPFRSGGLIQLAVPPEAGPILVRMYDVRGRVVRDLVSGPLDPGTHVISWDGRNEVGRLVPSGVYFVRLRTRDATDVLKIVKLP